METGGRTHSVLVEWSRARPGRTSAIVKEGRLLMMEFRFSTTRLDIWPSFLYPSTALSLTDVLEDEMGTSIPPALPLTSMLEDESRVLGCGAVAGHLDPDNQQA